MVRISTWLLGALSALLLFMSPALAKVPAATIRACVDKTLPANGLTEEGAARLPLGYEYRVEFTHEVDGVTETVYTAMTLDRKHPTVWSGCQAALKTYAATPKAKPVKEPAPIARAIEQLSPISTARAEPQASPIVVPTPTSLSTSAPVISQILNAAYFGYSITEFLMMAIPLLLLVTAIEYWLVLIRPQGYFRRLFYSALAT